MEIQPWLHDLVSCVAAPAVVLGSADGAVRQTGASGLLISDRRLLSTLLIDFSGVAPSPVGAKLISADSAVFSSAARNLGDIGPDPTVLVTQHRQAVETGFRERVTVENRSSNRVKSTLRIQLGADFATMHNLKTGRIGTEVEPTEATKARCFWAEAAHSVSVALSPAAAAAEVQSGRAILSWQLDIAPGERAELEIDVQSGQPPLFLPPIANPLAGEIRVTARDPRLGGLVNRAVSDLRHLVVCDPADPKDAFLAAGSPWFFTLFGRDSLWTARMLLPLGTDLAYGTLRTLARRQGTKLDDITGEAPGKIMHELRPGPPAEVGGNQLPPSYYGTIDATPLWVSLLAEARAWGLGEERVRELLPALEAALGWILDHSGLESGFLRYLDKSGHGLSNQGWKDSGNSIQHADGTLAQAPIALCEVQGYAYQALQQGADLLVALDESPDLVARARAAAGLLKERFRSEFWVGTPASRYPAVALDAELAQVRSVTSNIGHLLGTGLLDESESAQVAAALTEHELVSPYGLRTLSAVHPAFNPLGYHTGSIWPHDTAIVIQGLAKAGHGELAMTLAAGLAAAGDGFEQRLPELFHGDSPVSAAGPLPYPASCRPQAWSAAAGLVAALSALELRVDVPKRLAEVRALPEYSDWWPMAIHGLRIAGQPVDIEIDAFGRTTVETPLDFISVHPRPQAGELAMRKQSAAAG